MSVNTNQRPTLLNHSNIFCKALKEKMELILPNILPKTLFAKVYLFKKHLP